MKILNDTIIELADGFEGFLLGNNFEFKIKVGGGDLYVNGDAYVINDLLNSGRVIISYGEKYKLEEFNISDALLSTTTVEEIVNKAKECISRLIVIEAMSSSSVSMEGVSSSEYYAKKDEISMKVKELCNKVINTDPEVDFHGSCPAGIAFCVFCDAETRLPIFEKVQHKEHCAVLLAKEILKAYE